MRPLLINVAIALHLHKKCFLLGLDLTTMLHINKAVCASVRFLLLLAAVATIFLDPERLNTVTFSAADVWGAWYLTLLLWRKEGVTCILQG